jgi:hypothetical protein
MIPLTGIPRMAIAAGLHFTADQRAHVGSLLQCRLPRPDLQAARGEGPCVRDRRAAAQAHAGAAQRAGTGSGVPCRRVTRVDGCKRPCKYPAASIHACLRCAHTCSIRVSTTAVCVGQGWRFGTHAGPDAACGYAPVCTARVDQRAPVEGAGEGAGAGGGTGHGGGGGGG